MKKNKHSESFFHRTAVRVVILMIAIPALCLLCTMSMLMGIPSKIGAYVHIYEMVGWELPPDSQFIEFTAQPIPAGGTRCLVEGSLIIQSDLSQSELYEFYNSRYDSRYSGREGGDIPVGYFGDDPDGSSLYGIRILVFYRC